MPGYWWECEGCSQQVGFKEVTGTSSIYGFLWGKLVPSEWDQKLLVRTCAKCQGSMRITYDFPREEKETVRVHHVVGLVLVGGNYLPMMWEGAFKSEPDTHFYDLKYLGRGKGGLRGLNRPAVLSQEDLKNLFALYCRTVGVEKFP